MFSSTCITWQAKITPILPLPDHVEYQEGTFLFPKELRVYAEQATATFQYMKAELEKRFDIRVLQIRQQEKADCILLNTHRNSQSEAYILTIKSSYIKMQADTETGLFYALQSLIQLRDGTRERPMQVGRSMYRRYATIQLAFLYAGRSSLFQRRGRGLSFVGCDGAIENECFSLALDRRSGLAD